ncbi:MAG: hypothetical protein HQQ73_00140 [Desulfobulbaceae bacterium]|nr:hypothetical protein [Desulfobulbaceae bacterium]
MQEEFRSLFAILCGQGLTFYLTMDVLSFTPALKAQLFSPPRPTVNSAEICQKERHGLDMVFK